jgi:hypothetical protein
MSLSGFRILSFSRGAEMSFTKGDFSYLPEKVAPYASEPS